METLRKDLVHSLRLMLRHRSVTTVILLTLMVGIGANTAIFSIVYGVLLRPLPYQNAEQLVRIFDHWKKSTEAQSNEADVAPANFYDWKEQTQSFSGIAAFATGGAGLASGTEPEKVNAAVVSSEFFNVMGVNPALGRLLDQDDVKAPTVIILSYELWQRQFGGNTGVVGQSAKLDGALYTIVGIAPKGFIYPEKTQVWAPLVITANPTVSRDAHFLKIVARLKPGVTPQQAQSEMNTVAARLEQQYPATNRDLGTRVVAMHEHAIGKVKTALMILLMAVGFVLLIACANIANLLLARAFSRQKEMSVRIALGANRGRLIRQLLTESLVLAVAGGILGLLFAAAAMSFLVSITVGDVPFADRVGLNAQVLVFTFVVSVLTGTLFGLIPALQTTKVDLNEVLKEGGGKGVGTSTGSRVRGALVVVEVALTLVLLIGAGLMIKSFANLLQADLGFQTQNILTFELDLPNKNYPDNPKTASFYDSLVTRLKSLPGVKSVGGVTMLPLGGDNRIFSFRIEGQPVVDPAQRPTAGYRIAMPEYFSSMGIPLESGRMFSDADTQGGALVLMINDRMAKRYFPQGNPIGQRIYVRNDENPREIVGVVKSVKHFALDQEAEPEMYVPYGQAPSRYMRMVVRSDVAPRTLVNAVQRQVRELDPELPVAKMSSMDELVSKSVSQQWSSMVLLTLFAAVGLILAAVGIYGVLSYSVTQRTHEIGIRMALGASRNDILKLIITKGMMLTAIGIVLGIAGAYGLTRAIKSLLFGVGTLDVSIFVMVPAVFAIIALGACFFPARKASRVDPIVALRYQELPAILSSVTRDAVEAQRNDCAFVLLCRQSGVYMKRWLRKCNVDNQGGNVFPLPTQVVSNEEFYPLPQTTEQHKIESSLIALADGSAKRLGITRRQFLLSSGGMAAAFVALNSVFGKFFEVDAHELFEPTAYGEKWPKNQFIFDVQTHHVAAGRKAMPILGFRRMGERFNPALLGRNHQMEDLYLTNYIKEIFLDSDTLVAVITGYPAVSDNTNILPAAEMIGTRTEINGLAKSRRLISHGLFAPDLGPQDLESMQRQAEVLKVEAWKGYPGQPLGPGREGWWMDDEQVAYPAYEYARKSGIKTICVHKGLPLPGFDIDHCSPRDVPKAAADFPDLTFIIYHSGFRSLQDSLLAAADRFKTSSYVPWVSDLCEARKKNPKLTNVYMELGSTFGQLVITEPLLCGHVLGMILQAFGEDHVLWGTDSIWWGSPQWQIEAFRRFQIPEELMNRFGYKPLTAEVKQKIFGLNAARIYGVDVNARLNIISEDSISKLKERYRASGISPSNTQYGWVVST